MPPSRRVLLLCTATGLAMSACGAGTPGSKLGTSTVTTTVVVQTPVPTTVRATVTKTVSRTVTIRAAVPRPTDEGPADVTSVYVSGLRSRGAPKEQWQVVVNAVLDT